MKITIAAIGAVGFASLTGAQNGNDPPILNNRTGLAPVVYDSFTTSYTSFHKPVQYSFSVPLTPSPVHSNTFIKPTNYVQCWRDGYPCNQYGGQRSQRRVANFARATPKIARRVPPPEFLSSRTELPLPGQTDVAEDTDDGHFDILPIPTSLLGGEQISILPQFSVTDDGEKEVFSTSMSVAGGKQCGVPPSSSETGEAVFSVLPIYSTSSSERTAIPTEWWRGPSVSNPVQEPSPAPQSLTDDCYRHYCPNGDSTAPFPPASHTPPSGHGPPASMAITSTQSEMSPKPAAPIIDAPYVQLPGLQDPNIEKPEQAGVPIDWWRGSNSPVTPEVPGLLPRQESTTGFYTVDCDRHYCTSGQSGVIPIFAPTISYPPDTWPHTTSLFTVPPDPTDVITNIKAVDREVLGTGKTVSAWPSGPALAFTINGHGLVLDSSITSSDSATIATSPACSSPDLISLPTSHPCFRHYCPSGWSTTVQSEPVVTLTTLETSTST